MTQQVADVNRQQQVEAAAQQDPLLRLLLDIGKDRHRLRQDPEPAIKQLAMEMNETLASYVEETIGSLLQVRNWITESLADIDQRLVEVEAGVDDLGAPDLSSELVEKIVRVCGEGSAMAQAMLEGSPTADDESKKKLSDFVVLCAEVVDEVASDDDDEPEDETEEQPGA